MNHWHIEKMAEYHREDLLNENKQIRLVELALKSRLHKPGLFTRLMHGFASWMILKGKELHQRYEIPTEHSHQTPSSSFAH